MESLYCPWCEEAPARHGAALCGICSDELHSWSAEALAQSLAVLETLANASKRVALIGKEIADDSELADQQKIEEVRALVCQWCVKRSRCTRARFPAASTCPNCGAATSPEPRPGFCGVCRRELAALSREELIRRLGSSAAEALYWRTVVVRVRQAVAEREPCAAQMSSLRFSLSYPPDLRYRPAPGGAPHDTSSRRSEIQ